MKNVFYSPTERILFWIAGYTDESYKIGEKIKMLQEKATTFISVLGRKDFAEVRTEFITTSRRYKYMRVFWIIDIEPHQIPDYPKNVFIISDNKNKWTMNEWIHQA